MVLCVYDDVCIFEGERLFFYNKNDAVHVSHLGLVGYEIFGSNLPKDEGQQ